MTLEVNMDIKPKNNDEETISKWSTFFTDCVGNQQQLFEAMSRWYDNFNAVYSQKIAPWRSKVIDPKVASKALNIIAKLSLNDIEPNLHPNDKHDFIKARNNEQLLIHDLNNPNFDIPLSHKKYSVLSDAVVAGTGFALTPWTIKNRKFYSRVLGEDGTVDLKNEKVKEMKIGYNEFVPWSVFRVFIEKGAQSIYRANRVIFQDFKTTEELKEGDVFGNYTGLDDLGSNSNVSGTEGFEKARNRFMNNTLGSNSSYSSKNEIWHCFDRINNEYLVIANGSKIIRRQKNIYWHGKIPAVPFYIRPRAHDVWGDSIFQRTERLGSANDNIINHFLDQLDLSLNGVIMRRQGVDVRYDMSPGGEIVWDGTEKPEQWQVNQPDLQGFQIARQMISEAIEENTIVNYESGLARSEMDKTQGTKGGTLAIQEAGSDMVRFFEKTYAESWKEVFTMWLSNNQQLLDREVAIRVLGPNGYYPKIIKPQDIVTMGTLDIDIDTDFARPKSKEADRALNLAWVDKQLEIAKVALEMGQPIKLNFYEMSRTTAESMGRKNYDRILEPMPETNDSPMEENDLMLQGKETEPQQGEDHATHIQIHQELLDDEGVDQQLQEDIVIPHMMVHQQFLDDAKKQVEADLESLTNGASPQGVGNVQVQNAQQLPENLQNGNQGAMGGVAPVPSQVGAGIGVSDTNAGI